MFNFIFIFFNIKKKKQVLFGLRGIFLDCGWNPENLESRHTFIFLVSVLLCLFPGCYGFWCCPCLACTVSSRFGENRCLPLCDLCSLAVTSALEIPLLIASPALLSLRASMRHKHNIKVRRNDTQIKPQLKHLILFSNFVLQPTGSPCRALSARTSPSPVSVCGAVGVNCTVS